MNSKEYISYLGLKQSYSTGRIGKDAARIDGVDTDIIKKLVKYMDLRGTPGKSIPMKESDFYTLKNSDYKTSIAFSGLLSTEYLRMVYEYLEDHSEQLGETILDIGCDNGLITCFIAQLCPDAIVTGIDINENAITVSKQLAEELSLTNVTFEVADLETFNGNFDTVVSSRTAAEYSMRFERNVGNAFGEPLDKQAEHYKQIFTDFSGRIASLAAKAVISFERLLFNGGYLGFCAAMNDSGLVLGLGSHIREKHREAIEASNPAIQIALFTKGEHVETEALINNIIGDYECSCYASNNMLVYSGFDADIFMWQHKCELVEGCYFKAIDAEGPYKIGKEAVYRTSDGEKICLRSVFLSDGRDNLLVLDPSRENEILDTLKSDTEAYRQSGALPEPCLF